MDFDEFSGGFVIFGRISKRLPERLDLGESGRKQEKAGGNGRKREERGESGRKREERGGIDLKRLVF